jgi:hypothetical protein
MSTSEPSCGRWGDNRAVLDWQRMVLVVAVLGVLVLLLRWAFTDGARSSLVAARPRVGRSDEYGLLVAIAAPGTYIEGELACRRLEQAGIRATLVTTADGPRVMVFREQESAARQLLAAG